MSIRRLATCFSTAYLERGWVIANHKLVSFHAAFISSVLSLPAGIEGKLETLRFMFLSSETLISLVMLYLSWHIGIAIHEMGHYLTAARLSALNPGSQEAADRKAEKGILVRSLWYLGMFARIPWGRFDGIRKDNGNFSPDAPYNLAVSAAGPVWSSVLAAVTLPVAAAGITIGLVTDSHILVYVGRFFLAPGIVGLLDRLLADRGKLAEFRTRERRARQKQAEVAERGSETSGWLDRVAEIRTRMLDTRMDAVELAGGSTVSPPWQFRNCAMGGRHTEKEYPESNISMQESMFIPLSATSYEESQEMIVSLQYRLKEIIESAPGAKVMGIGLEGGLAPYLERDPEDRVPEQRLWRLMKQAILDSGLEPGVDVAIALDPAASELENAYRIETGQMDSVGMYRFWRDKSKVDMSRDEVLGLYLDAMQKDGIPILSIEDGFGELDHDGWKLAMRGSPDQGFDGLGEKIFIVGDDLVTTKDESIERSARGGEINATLIKANQIGTLSETVLAMLTSLAYGAELIVSHRSKSPNDPFEADIATAMNTLGLKAGGGANTERLQKYGRVTEILSLARMRVSGRANFSEDSKARIKQLLLDITGRDDLEIDPDAADESLTRLLMKALAITVIDGNEEPTNAGIPSAAATVMLGSTGAIRFKGSTPLGTSAGEDEAIHYVDSIIEPGEITDAHPELFTRQSDRTFRFAKNVDSAMIREVGDEKLTRLWRLAGRYGGKGCTRAVEHIESVLSRAFMGRDLGSLTSILETDRELLKLELDEALRNGRLDQSATEDERIHAMQRKSALGMNAILSVSLALGRALAASEGRELWELIRQMATDVMSSFIGAVSPEQADTLREIRRMDFEQLKKLFREAAQQPIGNGEEVYRILRKQLPVYRID